MLIKPRPPGFRSHPRQGQGGVVLIIALIVLVAMTLAALALVRSVDTNNVIAGNLAFQQAAVHSADTGVETATAWLVNPTSAALLLADSPSNGYAATGSRPENSPAAGITWDAYWTASLDARSKTLSTDSAGNTVSYVIDRLCANAGPTSGGASCIASPVVASASGSEEEAGGKPLNAPSVVYYRITVRVAGPRNTVSYVQSMVSM